jgi:hypothetical protein
MSAAENRDPIVKRLSNVGVAKKTMARDLAMLRQRIK